MLNAIIALELFIFSIFAFKRNEVIHQPVNIEIVCMKTLGVKLACNNRRKRGGDDYLF